jgi:hypothetical protein
MPPTTPTPPIIELARGATLVLLPDPPCEGDRSFAFAAVLHHFGRGGTDPGSFASALLDLLGKADQGNREKLGAAFPRFGVPWALAANHPGGTRALEHALILESEHRGWYVGTNALAVMADHFARFEE